MTAPVVAAPVATPHIVAPHVVAAVALAVAVLVAGGRPGAPRLRALARPRADDLPAVAVRPMWVALGGLATGAGAWAVSGAAGVAGVAGAAGLAAGLLLQRRQPGPGRPAVEEPADLAAAWAQLAVCLEVGLPVAAAVTAAAEPLTGRVGAVLRRVAGLLALGADPEEAWHGVRDPPLAAFARSAARSAGTGAALARAARTEAKRIRDDLADAAEARAQRAAVLITAPLGLCFLPAFLAVGIAPVVIGLAWTALAPW